MEYSHISIGGPPSAMDINDPNPAINPNDIRPNMVGYNGIMIRDREDSPDRYQERPADAMSRSRDAGAQHAQQPHDGRPVAPPPRVPQGPSSRITDDRGATIREATAVQQPMNPYPHEPK